MIPVLCREKVKKRENGISAVEQQSESFFICPLHRASICSVYMYSQPILKVLDL